MLGLMNTKYFLIWKVLILSLSLEIRETDTTHLLRIRYFIYFLLFFLFFCFFNIPAFLFNISYFILFNILFFYAWIYFFFPSYFIPLFRIVFPFFFLKDSFSLFHPGIIVLYTFFSPFFFRISIPFLSRLIFIFQKFFHSVRSFQSNNSSLSLLLHLSSSSHFASFFFPIHSHPTSFSLAPTSSP